jgi:flagellar motor switch protein FliN/FliY
MDVTCAVEVVLGSCAVKVRDCFAFERGTVVPLAQLAGADLELRAAGVPLAQGEIVVLEDRAHLRINRILPSSDLEAA